MLQLPACNRRRAPGPVPKPDRQVKQPQAMEASSADVLILGMVILTLMVRMLRLFYHSLQTGARRSREVKNHPEWGEAVEGSMDLGNPEI